jgi:hypothetical protein
MNLLEFYNGVFRPEVREALNNEYISKKLLPTVAGQSRLAFPIGKDVQATPITCILSHTPTNPVFFGSSASKINFGDPK